MYIYIYNVLVSFRIWYGEKNIEIDCLYGKITYFMIKTYEINYYYAILRNSCTQKWQLKFN